MRVLNRVARKCGLQPVADNAARAKVESLAADVLARDLLPADVEAVNNSMQKYQATFEAAVPNPEGSSAACGKSNNLQISSRAVDVQFFSSCVCVPGLGRT